MACILYNLRAYTSLVAICLTKYLPVKLKLLQNAISHNVKLSLWSTVKKDCFLCGVTLLKFLCFEIFNILQHIFNSYGAGH